MLKSINRRYAIGLFFILCVVIIWVCSSTLIQYTYETESFDKPFFLTFFFSSLFSVYLLGFLFFKSWRELWDIHLKKHNYEILKTSQSDNIKLKVSEIAKLSLGFCPLWMLSNYSYNYSLKLTSIASNTIISVCSAFFTFIIGIFYKIEYFSFKKLFLICLCISGISVIMVSDRTNSGGNSLVGDLIALFSAAMYGFYTIYLKRKIKDEKLVNMPIFFGLTGLFVVLIFWPIFFILHYLNIEIFQLPSQKILIYLVINGLVGTVFSDLLWGFSVLLTSPLVATLSISLTAPLALLVDLVFKHKVFQPIYILGTLFVLLSFLLINYATIKTG